MPGLRFVIVGIGRILLLTVPIFLVGAGGASALETETEIPLLQEALLRGDFALLEEKFTAWQHAYEDGTGSEWTVEDNFETFQSSNPEFEARLDEWNEAYPQSFVAPAARGLYLGHRIDLVHDNLNAAEVPDEVFGQIETWRAAANRDYLTAVRRNPRLTVAYSGLMLLAIGSHDGPMIDRIYEQGMKVNPASAVIEGTYLASLRPDWNPRPGTFEQMEGRLIAQIRDLQRRYRDNPDFDWLDGYEHFVAASALKQLGCNDEAMAEYGKAIAARDNWYYYLDRALTSVCLARHLFTPEQVEKRGKTALTREFQALYRRVRADFEQAALRNPYNAYVRRLAGAYRQELCSIRTRTPPHVLDHCLAAMAHLRVALSRDPLDPQLALSFASLTKQLNPRTKVGPYVDRALVYGRWNYRIQRHVAMALIEIDPQAADEHFRESIRLATDEEGAEWVLRDYLLVRSERHDCSAFPMLAQIERICRGKAGCAKKFDHLIDAFQMQSGRACGAVTGPIAFKPLPMPDDVVPQ